MVRMRSSVQFRSRAPGFEKLSARRGAEGFLRFGPRWSVCSKGLFFGCRDVRPDSAGTRSRESPFLSASIERRTYLTMADARRGKQVRNARRLLAEQETDLQRLFERFYRDKVAEGRSPRGEGGGYGGKRMNRNTRIRPRVFAAKFWADGLLFEALEGLGVFWGEPLNR